jgi:hypothetical protein
MSDNRRVFVQLKKKVCQNIFYPMWGFVCWLHHGAKIVNAHETIGKYRIAQEEAIDHR